ncbi:protein of unknown function [Streptococcus thermophilus]|nr:protein of unknown function [Streptococcus thermophilus]CAD0137518.1 protein of unknown function [Streptococcus thermophilus]CAD0182065.1 protein of unknown function [Streptococcus thermophilus]CAD0193052.1 protein of unknown function [Streptococcus thermophilus]
MNFLTFSFLILFFGRLLFHLISETKSQYTLPYIYLQLPMIAAGYIYVTKAQPLSKVYEKVILG